MDTGIHFLKEHRLIWAIGLSGLLHLFFFLFYARWGEIRIFPLPATQMAQPERRIAFEIVETPEESQTETPPEKADLLSDKNALARDQQESRMEDRGEPYSQGFIEAKSISAETGEGKNAAKDRVEAQTLRREDVYTRGIQRTSESSEFSRSVLLGQIEASEASQPSVYKQKEFSVPDVGGLSFNTYAWDFAPYILELKRRIERNIYPPPAFTQLGFGGKNILQFRIYPDGHLEGPEVLDYEGQKALVETSRKAIEISSPFWPLPEDFPEKYLEVTAKFYYFVLSR